MKKLGIIEIGVNIFNLTLVEIDDNGYFKILDQIHSSVALSTSLLDTTKLSEENLNVTISTLKSFKSMCQVSGVNQIIAVATEAFREATNSYVLADLIKDLLSIDIKILSVEEEINFNFLAVSHSIRFDNSLLVDIEGSATHISWIKDNKINKHLSLPFGYLNLTSQNNLVDIINPSDLNIANEKVLEQITSCDWLKENSFDSLISSDSITRALGRINRAKKKYPLDISHNYKFFDSDVDELYSLLKSKDLKSRSTIEGIDDIQAKTIVGGTLILSIILKLTSINDIICSSNGLSQGVMYNYIKENYNLPNNMVKYSLDGIIDRLSLNRTHAYHVYSITKKLFVSLKGIHKLNISEFENILKTASLLHDCGTSIDYYNHHRHSFYIILNSEINGLTHKEMLLSAAIAASHRNNQYKLSLPQYSGIISKSDLKAIDYIGALLRIAEGLDRSLDSAVKDFSVIVNSEKVILYLNSHLDLEFEINQGMRACKHFKSIYKRELIIEKF